VAASGELLTAIPTTAVWALLEESRVCTEESIALLSAAVNPQKKLGCSQGNMPGTERVSEQGGNVEAIDVLGAATLKQKAPNK